MSTTAQWTDLPDDLLGNIRFRIASLPPRTQSGLKKHMCGAGPDDTWVLRLPDKAAHKTYIGSHDDGWVATFDSHLRQVSVVNLFSGVQLGVCSPSPCLKDEPWFMDRCHVVFSDAPTSSTGCILAAIIDSGNKIALCKVGYQHGWTHNGWVNRVFTSIVFYNGDLYGLTYKAEELIRFKIAIDKDGSPVLEWVGQLTIREDQVPTIEYQCYMMELHGKLSKAVRTRWLPNCKPFFKVFNLVDSQDGEAAYQHKWVEMTSFGEYALFLGPARSKAVHVPEGAERRGFERNHIYYSIPTCSMESNLHGYQVHSLRSDNVQGMYSMEDQSIGDGLQRTMVLNSPL